MSEEEEMMSSRDTLLSSPPRRKDWVGERYLGEKHSGITPYGRSREPPVSGTRLMGCLREVGCPRQHYARELRLCLA